MPRDLAAGAMLVAVILAPTGLAFASLPHGDSPHDRITDDGAKLAGWEGGTLALREAVRAPDLDEHEYDPQWDEPGRIDGGPSYSNAHHCGRDAGNSSADSFVAAARHIHLERDRIVNHSEARDASKAMAALGRALHALQDCYSHSNIVDLPPDAQAAYERVVVTGSNVAAPQGLKVTGYDRGADEPGMPEGDDYPHDEFAKDDAEGNGESRMEVPDGRTKYEAARDLARNATAAFLVALQEEIGAGAWADLQEVEPDHVPKRWPVPGFALPITIASVALMAMALLRRWPDDK